jgi:adenylate cyclase
MEPMTAAELAQRAAVPGAFVDRLVELGILAPGVDGRFGAGDLHRARLLRSCERAGLPLEAIAAAIAAGQLSLGFLELSHYRWAGRSAVTFAHLAADSGIPVEYLLTFEESMGVERSRPDDLVREDLLAMVPVLKMARDAGIPDTVMPRVIRVYTEALRRVADVEAYVYHNYIELPMLGSGLGQAQIAELANTFGAAVTPAQEQMILAMYRRQQETVWTADLVEHLESALADMGRYRPPERPPAIAFLDLSGYTRLTEERGDQAAAELAADLGGLVHGTATRHGGLAVKWLGDGVMCFFPQPARAVSATLEMVASTPRVGLPAHAGVAAGPVIRQDADYFGRTVNVAARLAGRAGAGQTLVNDAVVRAAAPDGVRFDDLGPVELKGIPYPVRAYQATPDRRA